MELTYLVGRDRPETNKITEILAGSMEKKAKALGIVSGEHTL